MKELISALSKHIESRYWIRGLCLLAKLFYYGNRLKIKGKDNSLEIRTFPRNLKKINLEVIGDNNHIIFGNEVIASNVKIVVKGSCHELTIGEKCWIQGGVVWFEDYDCSINIGIGTSIQSAHIAVTEPGSYISIGEDCLLGNDIEIRNGDSHSIIDMNENRRINDAKNVEIGDHVWLAAHVRILKGSTVGENSIIGNSSVVTKDIPPNCVAVGVPARVVKSGVSWLRERVYNELGLSSEELSEREFYWALYDRGNALSSLGRKEEALASYERAIEIKRDYIDAWYGRGLVLAGLNRDQEAVDSFSCALQYDPQCPWVWYDQGNALARLGRLRDALVNYERAIEIKRDYIDAWYGRGLILVSLERYKDALESYTQALEFGPDRDWIWIDQGRLLSKLGNFDKAIDNYNRVLDQKPNHTLALCERGYAKAKLEDYGGAIADCEEALKIDNEDAYIWYVNARCYALKGSLESTKKSLQKAIELNPEEYQEKIRKDDEFVDLGMDLFSSNKMYELGDLILESQKTTPGAVFFLHGFLSGPGSYLASYFAKNFKLLGIDLNIPDFNQDDFFHLTLSRQIAQLQKTIPQNSVTLIGYSLGGLTAAWIAERQHQIKYLVLLAPSFDFPNYWLSAHFTPEQIDQWQSQGYFNLYHNSLNDSASLSYEFVEDFFKYPDNKIQRSIPTLILHGVRDSVISVESSRKFVKSRPWTKLIELDTDHLFTDAHEIVWNRTKQFLQL